MKKYIVGVDFGNGETTAWYSEIYNNKKEDSLRITNGGEPKTKKIRTVIYRSKNENFSSTGPGEIYLDLKNKISGLSYEKKEAYKAFIKDIYRRIIRNNSHLIDKETGEPDFYLCIATPTNWAKDEQQEYLNFFNAALAEYNQEILWVINESDAAYFTHRNDNENTLIIDYGSSSIDYTLICHGKKESEDNWSSANGAKAIEKVMLSSLRGTEKYQDKFQNTARILNNYGWDHINIESVLELELRKVKEHGFTEYNEADNFNYHLSYTFAESTNIKELENYTFFQNGRFIGENGVCNEYAKLIEKEFVNLKEKIAKKCNKIDTIIISGGGGNMFWVEESIKKVFGDITIIKDDNPEYVVSHGITLYAREQINALTNLKSKIAEIDFEKLYTDADKEAILTATQNLFPTILNNIKGETDYTGEQIFKMVAKFFYDLNDTNIDYCNSLKGYINKSLTSAISEKLAICIKEAFSKEIDTKNVKINIDPEIINFPKMFFNIDNNGGKKIYNSLKKATGPHISSYDPKKKRNKNARYRIAQKLSKDFLILDPFNIPYKRNNLKRVASTIKEKTLLETERLFYSEQLFTTTFKK